MLKVKYLFSIFAFALLFVSVFVFALSPKPSFASVVSAADVSIQANANAEQAEKDVIAAKSVASELKKIYNAAAGLAKVAKTVESKAAEKKAKGDYDNANLAVTAAIKKAAELKKVAVISAKAAKVEADAIAKAAALPIIKACVRTAVSIRERVLGSARTAYNEGTLGAYTVRTEALDKAYSTEGVVLKTETAKIWSLFKGSLQSTTKAWKLANSDAWKIYNKDVKACKATKDLTDASGQSMEAKGE